MAGIFISYSRKDSEVAHKLMADFKSAGMDVWVDWEDIPPAVGWLDQILQGIEQADAFLFLVSPDSIKSEVCKVEWMHAKKNAKRIIPIVVRDVDPNATETTIRDLNWIFLRETDDYAKGIDKVKLAIDLDVEWLREHRRLQVRALEWDRKKEASLLLRGADLRSAALMLATHGNGDPKPSELQDLYLSVSKRSERARTAVFITAAATLVIMILLSLFAISQRQVALENAQAAEVARQKAVENEERAKSSEKAAVAAKAKAITNEAIAEAQRSAARGQIYQSRTGGLFTSTLFAIDSLRRKPSVEADDILRKNISLLPIPVKQSEREGSILHIEISPDGSTFVSTSEDGSACLSRFEDGQNKFCVNSPGAVLDAVFSPDGKILVISDSSGMVQVLNADDGTPLKQFDWGVSVRDVNISPDGDLLAMTRDDARINLIRLSSYEPYGEFSVYGNLRVTAFSPDGEWFAAASDIGSITFWNLGTKQIITGGAHRDEIFEIAFSPNSNQLISGSADNCAVLTSPFTGEEILRVLNEDRVTNVAFSPDGTWFVTASDDFRIRVWDTKTGEERLRFLQDSVVSEVKISPDGLWIASTGSDRTVRVWSAASGSEMFQIPLREDGTVLEFSADNRYLVAGDLGGNISIWDISALAMNTGYMRFDEFVSNIEMSPDGGWYAASAGGEVWVFDPALFDTRITPQGKPIIDFHPDFVYDLAIDPQGNWLAASTFEGQVVLFNKSQGNTRSIASAGPAQLLAFTPDGQSLILGSEDGMLQNRGLDGSDNGILWQAPSAVYAIAVSTTNQLAVGMDGKVVILDLDTKTVVSEVSAPGANYLLTFSPDGNTLASSAWSSTSSGQTYVWVLEDGEYDKLAEYSGPPTSSILFDPKGSQLFLGGTDEIFVYDAITGMELNRIRQKSDVTGLTFSPDGETLFGSSLKTIQVYDLTLMKTIPEEEVVAAACSRLTRNFSTSEWRFFFNDEKYVQLCPDLPIP